MITYITGDATCPVENTTNRIITHICNDAGFWGRGFVMALSKRWNQPELQYRTAQLYPDQLKLGDVQFVQVEPGIWVANMIAQTGIGQLNGKPPLRYAALRTCLEAVANYALDHDASVHMPRISAGLAGGDWFRTSLMIDHILNGIDVTVYTLPKRS